MSGKARITLTVIAVIVLATVIAIYRADKSRDINTSHAHKSSSFTSVLAISAVKSKQYTWCGVSASYAEISVLYSLFMYSKVSFRSLDADIDHKNKQSILVTIELDAKEVMQGILDPVQMFPSQWGDPINYQEGVVPTKDDIRKMQEKIRQGIPVLRLEWKVLPNGDVSPANYYAADSLKFFRQYIKPKPKALLQREREDIDSLFVEELQIDSRWKLILSDKYE